MKAHTKMTHQQSFISLTHFSITVNAFSKYALTWVSLILVNFAGEHILLNTF